MSKSNLLFLLVFFLGCKKKQNTIKPVLSAITESVYASGVLKSEAQYQAFSSANGAIKDIYLKEGASVEIGTPILSIMNDLQLLNTENAKFAEQYAALSNNQGKLTDARSLITMQLRKMKNDSLLLKRQQNVWESGGGTKVELEQRGLDYEASKVAYQTAMSKFDELRRQLDFAALQSKKNLQISKKLASDFTLKSEISGVLYQLYKKTGESVNPQMPLALLGSNRKFVIEMQVDERDIFKVVKGQLVLVTLDSYPGKVFEANVTTISPMMNESSKTFLVSAAFIDPPKALYPFISFEANIIIQTKPKAMLIPISYLLNDSTVLLSNGKVTKIKIGLKDYKMVEVLNGISATDELVNPIQ
ncbi:MAG: efflux RND transporter periplasmic adaptor subunit [Pedobacter sp.]|nr:efflux RND transporter periplasmic adaptor subunit [Pedobacter sp.]